MKLHTCRTRILVCTFTLLAWPFSLVADNEEDAIGVVLSVSGDVVLQSAGNEQQLLPSALLAKSHVIALRKGAKTGKVQIGTIDGPIVFRKFPIRLDSLDIKVMPGDMRENYMASIGGTVLRGRQKEADIFDWSMDLGALDARDVEKGFYLAVSRTKSSAVNLSLNPVYFKLDAGVKVKSGTYEILVDTTGVSLYKGSWTEKAGDLALMLDTIKYESGVDYRVRNVFVLEDGERAEWNFKYTIFSKEDIGIVEEEIAGLLKGDEREFAKKLLAAGKYMSYNFKLKALSLLKDAGIDIEGML